MKQTLLFTYLIVATLPLLAQWETNGTPVSVATSLNYKPFIAAAPKGGSYIAWQEIDTVTLGPDSIGLKPNTDIRIAALNDSGKVLPGWPAGGYVASQGGDFYLPQLIATEQGDVIVGWYGYPAGSNLSGIYLQKYSYAGQAMWNGGYPVQVNTDHANVNEYPVLISDKKNGAFVAWTRFDSVINPASSQVMIQRIGYDGHVGELWPDTAVVVAPIDSVRQLWPQIALTPDQSSVYITYQRGYIGNTSLTINKFNYLDGLLAPYWPISGITITPGPNVFYDNPFHDLKIFTDSSNNASVVWLESRFQYTLNEEIFMQQVDPLGNILLEPNGRYLDGGGFFNDGAGDSLGVSYLEVEQDSERNLYVACNNYDNTSLGYELGLMKVQPNGRVLWFDSVLTSNGISAYPVAVPDGKGGTYVFYANVGGNNYTLNAIALNSSGRVDSGWALPGSTFGEVDGYDPYNPNYDFSPAYSRTGEAIVTWSRVDSLGLYNIFACNIISTGQTCIPNPAYPDTAKTDTTTGIQIITNVAGVLNVFPDPFNEQITVYYNGNSTGAGLTLKIFDLAGRLVQQNMIVPLVNNNVPTESLLQGMYLYRLVNDDTVIANGKMVKQ
jgi:hypothetical protein